MKKDKKQIREYVLCDLNVSDLLTGNIQEITDRFLKFKEYMAKTNINIKFFEDLNLIIDFEFVYDIFYDDKDELSVYMIRYETDEEYEERLLKEKKRE